MLDKGQLCGRRSAWLPPLAPQAKAVQDYVTMLLENSQKFLVFGHHTCMLDAIEHACNRFKSGKKGIKWVLRGGCTA